MSMIITYIKLVRYLGISTYKYVKWREMPYLANHKYLITTNKPLIVYFNLSQ